MKLPKFRTIGILECLDLHVVMRALVSMAIIHVSMLSGKGELPGPGRFKQVIIRRRLEPMIIRKLAEHASVTGRPITENSVLRVMEFWDRERVHMLVFRDAAHMRSCVRASIVQFTLEA